ncbi:hypothetical protein Dsin_025416 [Dipteronia sinensis]|uniref:Pectinesterase inhibitor domain-containing protein n=1 Tax=Dipteronia sinensis TaxID=43782 RepID=A0AAD9ZWC9_9ROSI|nr:hypothetical protein Dsin_025416 [Dipteronia sinensis]
MTTGARLFISLVFVLFAWLQTIDLCQSASVNENSYVQDACSVTQYRVLCVHSLASFSNTAKTSPSKWARAGVSVTIGEAKTVNQYLISLKKHYYTRLRGRNRVALLDCMETFQDTIDQLHKSLGILRKLSAANFESQMGDLTTFMSAALTDQDTCLDGFEGQRGGGAQVNLLKNRVLNATYLTSNALALVNKLATSGLNSLTDP